MPTIDDLLLEKRRYGLEQKATEDEIKKLNMNMPIQLIMGYVEFLNTRINLNYNVLIPRYETEEMVDLVLKKYIKNNMKILDLCTGSGFIAISLKKNNNTLDLTASDIDSNAIKQTKENAELNLGKNHDIKIIQSDLFKDIKGKYDIIISNPPYVAYDDKDAQSESLKFEPEHAIFAPKEGWYFYEKILEEAPIFLNKNGLLIFEINPKHKNIWKNIKNSTLLKDINDKYRFAIVKF
ncbi:protoporphyrinogen oxidase [Mycoplasmopsis maculosa]|uniref:peptide chain release factor N(5)-glutamine methyltransferase n=1 Tax=Mycoplasmopsis maculosa TaxID=114885 RepID=A0A449B477_9BACT|nr:peptide chain release factor N(5)-glutamine methyltransferase [Mycoplasmopsis maculosa]VEU75411.1 protoporphyrinogen oxidase [Mycoplasmopsis maculosa]